MIHVEEVNDAQQLSGCRLAWNSLLPQTRDATFFQSLDWLEVYWRHFGFKQRLRVLLVRSERRVIGILPLVVRTELTRVGPLRVLTYPLHDWGTFYAPIGQSPTAALLAGLRHVRETRRDWDLLDLRWIDWEDCDRGRTERAMQQVGFRPYRQAWARAPVIDLQGTWQEYWSSRPAKWRQNLGASQRRLERHGEVTLVRYRPEGAACGDDDPRWDLYDACMAVARESWQGSSPNGTTLCHDSVGDYLRETHAAAARSGALDLNLLLIDGRPAAFLYNYCYQGRIYGLRQGFDPELGPLRPGAVLQKMVLEDSFRRGDSHYDLGVGSLAGKRFWQTSIKTSYRCTHFPLAAPRVQLLRLKRWLLHSIYGDGRVACAQMA